MMMQRFDINGVDVLVTRKAIKNVYLSVRSSNGEVRLSVPLRMRDVQIRRILDDRFDWIMRKKKELGSRSELQRAEMISGEYHYLFGRQFVLDICLRPGRPQIDLSDEGRVMYFCVHGGVDRDARLNLLREWYRQQLKIQVVPLLSHWQQRIGVDVSSWHIKRMKTRWGSCNVRAKRIWLNLMLAQKPLHCLEYIVVHELLHLIERCHTPRFYGLMDHYLPDWGRRDLDLKNGDGVMDLHH